MATAKAAPASTKRQMRFELEPKHHTDAKILRAQTDLPNDALWVDMVRVYKKHPTEWASAKAK